METVSNFQERYRKASTFLCCNSLNFYFYVIKPVFTEIDVIGLTVKKDLSRVRNINPIALKTASLGEIGLK